MNPTHHTSYHPRTKEEYRHEHFRRIVPVPEAQRLLFATAPAALAIGAGSYGIRSRVALAEPGPPLASRATMSMTQQSVQPRAASADADFGPGQCEPCVVAVQ